jgi:hypothetical protein
MFNLLGSTQTDNLPGSTHCLTAALLHKDSQTHCDLENNINLNRFAANQKLQQMLYHVREIESPSFGFTLPCNSRVGFANWVLPIAT